MHHPLAEATPGSPADSFPLATFSRRFAREPGVLGGVGSGQSGAVSSVNQPLRNRPSPTTKRFFPVAVWLAALLASSGTARAAESETNRFVVLELKVTAAEVSIVAATEVAGQPKPQPKKAGVDFEIRSRDNAVLRSGQIADPRLRSFCYEHPPGSGQMTNTTVTADEGHVTLRVPSDSTAASIEFFESRRPGLSLQSTRRSLGKFAFTGP